MKELTILIILLVFTLSTIHYVNGKHYINFINSKTTVVSKIKSPNQYTIVYVGSQLVEPVDNNGNPLNYTYTDGFMIIENNHKVFNLIPNNTVNIQNTKISLTGWSYRTPIIIQNRVDKIIHNYQVKIVLNSSWDGWSYVNSDGSDIRFVDENEYKLPYYIEEWDYSNKKAIIWVKIPVLYGKETKVIYMYYGNQNVQSESDPNKVFDFFDNFKTLDSSKWNIGNGIIIRNNDELILNKDKSTGTSDDYIITKNPIVSLNQLVEVRVRDYKNLDPYNSQYQRFVLELDWNNFTFIWDYDEAQYGIYGYDSYYVYDGSRVHIYDGSYFHVDNKFHIYKFIPKTWEAYRDNTLTHKSVTVPITPTGKAKIKLKIWYHSVSGVDWIRVRKYVDPEPLVIVENKVQRVSETPKPETITINESTPLTFIIEFTPKSSSYLLNITFKDSNNNDVNFILNNRQFLLNTITSSETINTESNIQLVDEQTYTLVGIISNNEIIGKLYPVGKYVKLVSNTYSSFTQVQINLQNVNIKMFKILGNYDETPRIGVLSIII